MTPTCHCGLFPATVPATVAGVAIDLCPACVAHYRGQTWPDGSAVDVETGDWPPVSREWHEMAQRTHSVGCAACNAGVCPWED